MDAISNLVSWKQSLQKVFSGSLISHSSSNSSPPTLITPQQDLQKKKLKNGERKEEGERDGSSSQQSVYLYDYFNQDPSSLSHNVKTDSKVSFYVEVWVDDMCG